MRIRATLLAIVLLAPVAVLALTESPAEALCSLPQEQGNWRNVDTNTNNVTRIELRFVCQDQIRNGEPYPPGPPWYMKVWGRCSPSDCYWGEIGAVRDSGWIHGDYHFGWATKHVWAKMSEYYADRLYVYVRTDFHDGRTDYTWSGYFVRV